MPSRGIDAIVQGHFDIVANVFQNDIEVVLLDAVGQVAQDQVAISIFACNFEGWLVIARTAPAGKLLVFEHLMRVEGRDVASLGRRRQILDAPEGRAPIEILQRAVESRPMA